MTPKPIADAPRDGSVIIGLRKRGIRVKYWDGATMYWARPYLTECWRFTGPYGAIVAPGCEPTHFLPLEGANDDG